MKRSLGKRTESVGLERKCRGWKCAAGAGHARGGPGSCPRPIVVALVLWRNLIRSLIRGSSCSWLDAL